LTKCLNFEKSEIKTANYWIHGDLINHKPYQGHVYRKTIGPGKAIGKLFTMNLATDVATMSI